MSTSLYRRLAVAALFAITVVAAGCSSSSKSSSVAAGGSSASTTAASTASTASSGSSSPATVNAKSTSAGTILTDAAGLPVYTYGKDTAGTMTSACTGGCPTIWPPVQSSGTPTAGPGVTGTLAKLASGQVTLNGLPLYTFASDTAGGAPKGDGVGDFHLAMAGGSSGSTATTAKSGYGY